MTPVSDHPSRVRVSAGPLEEALPRVGEMLKHALGESERVPLLLENTLAPATRSGARSRSCASRSTWPAATSIGVCLDSCHMYASGFDISTADKLTGVMDRFKKVVGIRRLRCLHVNDSQVPLGSNRDRHAIPGKGDIGARGCAAFLSEPRFEGLRALFEGPGTSGHAPDKVDVDKLKELRKKGRAARKRRASR